MVGIRYYTPENPPRLVFVSTGISCRDDKWMTLYQKHPYTKGTHRLKSQALPIRATEKEAQDDLDRYATSHDFRREET
ncbi:MAG: hypothetical protein PHO67_08015 [Candidatus Omnitrophica bacterium]|nr:hypothetical protein [Candidatus Omnitrophota bacterium]